MPSSAGPSGRAVIPPAFEPSTSYFTRARTGPVWPSSSSAARTPFPRRARAPSFARGHVPPGAGLPKRSARSAVRRPAPSRAIVVGVAGTAAPPQRQAVRPKPAARSSPGPVARSRWPGPSPSIGTMVQRKPDWTAPIRVASEKSWSGSTGRIPPEFAPAVTAISRGRARAGGVRPRMPWGGYRQAGRRRVAPVVGRLPTWSRPWLSRQFLGRSS